MASQTPINLDPRHAIPASRLDESLGLSGQELHINIYCHTVIIERPPVSAPGHHNPPRTSKGVWDPSSGIPGFVKILYWNILDRDAESQTVVDHWTQQTYLHGLAHTVCGFFTALRSIPRGQEMSVEVLAEKFYLAVLGRQPEASGKVFWADKLRDGMTLLEAANGFVGSEEYRGKVQAGTRPDPIHWPVNS